MEPISIQFGCHRLTGGIINRQKIRYRYREIQGGRISDLKLRVESKFRKGVFTKRGYADRTEAVGEFRYGAFEFLREEERAYTRLFGDEASRPAEIILRVVAA